MSLMLNNVGIIVNAKGMEPQNATAAALYMLS
jgi:hypothetical protein